jgi:hypothetical protein
LESFLVEKEFTGYVSFTLKGDVYEFKTGTLPEIITGIHELIDSTIEATFLGELSITQPFN